MAEQPVTSSQACVLVYNAENKKWAAQGPNSGSSKVTLYHNPDSNTYRVVGRNLQDKSVVVNSNILRNTTYNRATESFHQWRDSRGIVYGLNFTSKDGAVSFALQVEAAIKHLNNPEGKRPPAPRAPAPKAPPQQQAPAKPPTGPPPSGPPPGPPPSKPPPSGPPPGPPPSKPPPSGPPPSKPPAAPPPQPASKTSAEAAPPQPSSRPSAVPPPPGPPPSGPPAAPPPPGPPPPPSSNAPKPPSAPPPPPSLNANGAANSSTSSLADQLKKVQLKTNAAPVSQERSSSPAQSDRSKPMDINAELAGALKKRQNRKPSSPAPGSPVPTATASRAAAPAPKPKAKPPPTAKKTAPTPARRLTGANAQATERTKSDSSSGATALGSGSSVASSHKGTSGSNTAKETQNGAVITKADFESFKEEIRTELRQQLDTMKDEIIQAFRAELLSHEASTA